MHKTPLAPLIIAQWGQLNLFYLPLYIPWQDGTFKKQGLDISLDLVGNDDQIYRHVTSGKADFGMGDPVFSAFDKKKNKAVCIASIANRVPIWGVTHNPAIGMLTDVKDFVRLRVGSFPAPSTTHSLIAGLKAKHKRLLNYLQIVEAPIGQQQALLTGGKADVVLEIEPMVTLAEEYGLRVVFSMAQFYGAMAFTGITASPRMQAQPEIIKKMKDSVQHGLDVCHTNKSKALQIAAKLFPNYPAHVLERAFVRLRQNKTWPKTIRHNEDAWNAAIALRKSLK